MEDLQADSPLAVTRAELIVSVDFVDAAAALSVSPRTVWNLVAKNQLRAFSVGRRRLISVQELRRFAERQTEEQNTLQDGN